MWHIYISHWVPKATSTLSVYVILIAILLQQWLHERTSLLHYTCIALLKIWAVTDFLHSSDNSSFFQTKLICL